MRAIKNLRGASAVEFALVLPLLAVILFGVIEFGLVMFNKQVITNASREGARRGIVMDDPRIPASEIESVAKAYCQNYLIGFSGSSLSTKTDAICTKFGDSLKVTVDYNYSFLAFPNLLKLLGGTINNSIILTSATVMKCE